MDGLPDEYFNLIGTTRKSVKEEMAKLQRNIEQTKQAAKIENPNVNLIDPSFTNYSVENCAEVWSVRKAIMEGAKFDEIEYKCVINENGAYAPPCENCKRTFSGLKNSGKEDEWYAKSNS